MAVEADLQRVNLLDRGDLFGGVCEAVALEGATAFFRHTTGVRRLYSEPIERRRRAFSTAGVRVAFRSDTRRLRLALRFGDGVEWLRQARCDLVVNGRLEAFFGPALPEIGLRWEGTVWRDAAARSRDFVLWLPALRQTMIESFEIERGASLQPLPRRPRWLVLGDSITQGYVTAHPSQGYAARAAEALGMEHVNAAVGGGVADPALAELARGLPSELATVALGVNDYARGIDLDAFGRNVFNLLAGLRDALPDARILWITPIPYVGHMRRRNKAGRFLGDYAAVIGEQAARVPRIEVLDGTPLLPEHSRWFVDNCHPNDRGHALYAQNLIAALKAPPART